MVNHQPISNLESILSDLVGLLIQYECLPEAEFLGGILLRLRRHADSEQICRDVAQDLLSAYRGMGGLDDVVIVANGTMEVEANDRLSLLLRLLRDAAFEIVTSSR